MIPFFLFLQTSLSRSDNLENDYTHARKALEGGVAIGWTRDRPPRRKSQSGGGLTLEAVYERRYRWLAKSVAGLSGAP
ncbi:hypothetical protein OKW35_005286 [Paraburkholderia sp. MM5477-R1]